MACACLPLNAHTFTSNLECMDLGFDYLAFQTVC